MIVGHQPGLRTIKKAHRNRPAKTTPKTPKTTIPSSASASSRRLGL